MEEILLDDNQLLEAIKKSGWSKSFQTYVQKVGDKRTTEGIETFKKNLDKKEFSESEKITNLEKELKELKDNTAKKDIETLIKNELKTQNLNEGLIKYLKIDDPSKIAESVQSLKSDLLEIKQGEIDLKLKGETLPAKGEPGKGGDSTLENYVENKNSGKVAGNPFQGKLDNKKGD
jgi:hypothetical protein